MRFAPDGERGVQVIVLGTDGDLFVDAIKRMAGMKN